jgi:hypothetical protein
LNGKNHTLWGRVNFAYTFVSILTAFLKVRVFPVHPMRSERPEFANQPFRQRATNDGGEPELTMLRVDQMAVVRLAAD